MNPDRFLKMIPLCLSMALCLSTVNTRNKTASINCNDSFIIKQLLRSGEGGGAEGRGSYHVSNQGRVVHPTLKTAILSVRLMDLSTVHVYAVRMWYACYWRQLIFFDLFTVCNLVSTVAMQRVSGSKHTDSPNPCTVCFQTHQFFISFELVCRCNSLFCPRLGQSRVNVTLRTIMCPVLVSS